jgi:hypothetical protein
MRPFFKPSVGLLVLLLCGCELKLKQAKTPTAPEPTVARAEPPPAPPANEPLSTPQTQVRLPEPQPVAPEAVATPPTPSEPASPRPKPRKRTAPQPLAATPAKPEPVETAETPPGTDQPPQRLEPLVPEDQHRQQIEEISSRLREVDGMLARLTARVHNERQKRTVERIRNFVALAYQARDQGDIQKASGLAGRALLLAQDLDRAK